jgi:hypothetical protein
MRRLNASGDGENKLTFVLVTQLRSLHRLLGPRDRFLQFHAVHRADFLAGSLPGRRGPHGMGQCPESLAASS